jgi:hypothetical protein
MLDRRSLDVIQVGKACDADWARMPGDRTRRFCAHCGKFVHNLSEVSADEAERLVCESAGKLCIRLTREASTGRVITLDYAPAPKTSRRRAILSIASIFAAVCGAAGLGAYKLLRKPPPAPTLVELGDVVIKPPTGSTAR